MDRHRPALSDSLVDARVRRQTDAILKTAPGAVATAKALCQKLGRGAEDEIATSIGGLADRWESDEAQARIRAFLGEEAVDGR